MDLQKKEKLSGCDKRRTCNAALVATWEVVVTLVRSAYELIILMICSLHKKDKILAQKQ